MEKDDKTPLPPSRIKKLPEITTGPRIDSTGTAISQKVRDSLERSSEQEDERWRTDVYEQFEVLREILFEADTIAENLGLINPELQAELKSFINAVHVFTYRLLESINIENKQVLMDIEADIVFHFGEKNKHFHTEKVNSIKEKPSVREAVLDVFPKRAKGLLNGINHSLSSERENYDRLNSLFDFFRLLDDSSDSVLALPEKELSHQQQSKLQLVKRLYEEMRKLEKAILETMPEELFYKFRIAEHTYSYLSSHLMVDEDDFESGVSNDDMLWLKNVFPDLFGDDENKLPPNSQILSIPQSQLSHHKRVFEEKFPPGRITPFLIQARVITDKFLTDWDALPRNLNIPIVNSQLEEKPQKKTPSIIAGAVFAAVLATLTGLLTWHFVDRLDEKKAKAPEFEPKKPLTSKELEELLAQFPDLGVLIPNIIANLRESFDFLTEEPQIVEKDLPLNLETIELPPGESFMGAIYEKEYFMGELQYVPQKFYFLIEHKLTDIPLEDLGLIEDGETFFLTFEKSGKKYVVQLTREELKEKLEKSIKEGHNSVLFDANITKSVIELDE